MKTVLLPLAILLATLTPHFGAESDSGFTTHEWGTFTSVQGTDGVQMDWNPLIISDLPKFVHDRARSGAKRGLIIASKTGVTCRQRMETPVIYFYSDQARTVDVSVNFPQGQITEWYPQESAADLGLRTASRAAKVPALLWKDVQVIPAKQPGVRPPHDPSGSHYLAARGTGSAMLLTKSADGRTEAEEFLFYRGTGSFTAPLTVKMESADPGAVTLSNSGQEDLRHLFLCEVRADGTRWLQVEKLPAGATQSVNLAQSTETKTEALAEALRSALVSEGLFAKEAVAMVKTWEASWLGERGLRVLYTLPRAWTDRTLPLAITPAPKATERVMVGRAEVITPAMEQALLGALARYLASPEVERTEVVTEARALGLGRFAEPTLRRIMTSEKRSAEFSAGSWELLARISAKESPAVRPPLAP